ncbi:chemotaxis protein [Halodesulfovibrio spirochaetisodalis]|uniref:Chemotaxis protein CheV n=1 Tax=Halodesulfovibrio spirochaetisodalis TaxID=1560234 RepID=A0A1B7XBP0_9BACT|nr:chemotaxis protein [Halodesulfovibrio spirochaetisodalis]OBQ50168.1 chemotaxis protein CheV [Halodesulfovibrio spirochaetisodalis]
MQTNILLESGTNELEIVEFFLDEIEIDGTSYRGYYGVNVAKVLEIIRMPTVTELPESGHSCILGAFNLRSQVIPLVDLSMWLGKHREENEPPKVIVTEFNNVCTAFQVSGVNRIHRISWEEVEPPSSYVANLSNQSITGVVKINDRIIFLLDLERIVANLNPDLALKLDDAIDWSDGEQRRALITDDSGLIREMLTDLMEKANFQVEAHNNGREAWDRLQQLKTLSEQNQRQLTDYVQVVVSDIEMPAMDGHSLCKSIKEDPVLKQLPVVLFSSIITDKLRHKGEAVGADLQVSKPEVTLLAQRAITLIDERRQQKSA